MVASEPIPNAAPISVVLGDGRRLVRAGLVRLLSGQPVLAVLAEAADTDELLRVSAAATPHVVMLDLGLPGDSLATVRTLRLPDAAPQVLVYGVPEDGTAVLAALQSGARGVLDANVDIDTAVVALVRVAAGEVALSPRLANHLMAGSAAPPPPGLQRPAKSEPALTEREAQVLREVASGGSNQEAAAALGISPNTIRAHLRSISRKLAAQSRLHLVGEAIRTGVLSEMPARWNR